MKWVTDREQATNLVKNGMVCAFARLTVPMKAGVCVCVFDVIWFLGCVDGLARARVFTLPKIKVHRIERNAEMGLSNMPTLISGISLKSKIINGISLQITIKFLFVK